MKKSIFIFLTFIVSTVLAQDKKVQNADMVWLGYFNSVKLNSKWSINSDVQIRTRNNLWYQYLARTGVVHAVNSKIYLLGGFATFLYPQINDQNLLRAEWRPWEEIMFADFIGRLKISHRFRAEQRFNQVVIGNDLIDDYTYNNRFRYKLDLQYPLFRADKNEHVVSLTLANEIMINAGKIIKYNYFDQNRLAVGINYAINPGFVFQLQLMHIWQQQANGYALEKDKVLRFNIYHTINVKKNASTAK